MYEERLPSDSLRQPLFLLWSFSKKSRRFMANRLRTEKKLDHSSFFEKDMNRSGVTSRLLIIEPIFIRGRLPAWDRNRFLQENLVIDLPALTNSIRRIPGTVRRKCRDGGRSDQGDTECDSDGRPRQPFLDPLISSK
jgi:hypothetical protein